MALGGMDHDDWLATNPQAPVLHHEAILRERIVNALSLVGSTLGKYQVLEELGQGGMAEVYKGYHPDLQRTVALKVLSQELVADQDFVKRFMHEARTAAQLKHANIVTVFDVDHDQDTYYIVMEFLPGRTLQEEIHHCGALPLGRIVEIMRALAGALDYAHQRELTHRDIKPSNVMIGPEGQITLMDFGIVKAAAGIQLTREGMRIGTPEYMSPEQARGQKVDRRSDIYSLGVVLYEMLVGQAPFRATSAHEVLKKHVQEEPPPPSRFIPDLPQGVEKVVLRALAKQPGKRFQTAGQLAAALEQAVLPIPKDAEARPRQTKLKLVASDGSEFHLTGVVGLGRSPDNQVQIPDAKISRHHAQIRCEGARCQIIDLGSVNGTFVNDDLLHPNVPRFLQPGDRVSLGAGLPFIVKVGTAIEPIEVPDRHISLGTTLREIVWKDRRRRTILLLSSGIGLILAILCLTMLLFAMGGGASGPSPVSAEEAVLTVLNATGEGLELEMGEHSWHLRVGQRRTIRFPAGEYDYTITLDSGKKTYGHDVWQPGNNGELQLIFDQP
jgi:serine/threonine protein kinase